MMRKDYKAFIVEGDVREPQIIDNLQRIHFKNSNFKVITISAGQNIYMLWKKLQVDNFETDIIEVLRESSEDIELSLNGLNRDDFSEIFLFFDYDGHQNNLSEADKADSKDVIAQMLNSFDNETENGKLYISYPMAEALRDYIPGCCGNQENCYCFVRDFEKYKQLSACNSTMPEFKKYSFQEWKQIINVFAMRISCLLERDEIISYEEYSNKITPLIIYELQRVNIEKNKIFVLSAFPEFLLDYFQCRFWNACLVHTHIRPMNNQECIR